jgi:signal transduction histidine kinase
MIPGFVHQLRSPLHIVGSSAQNMADSGKIPDGCRADLELIRRAADRAQAAVQNLLLYSKGEDLPFTVESLNVPVNHAVDYLKEECRKRNIQLDLREELKIPAVRIQSILVEEAILNFAVNALDAMPKGGVLGLTTQAGPEQSDARVMISDTGVGMTPAAVKRFGKAFSTGKKEGMGLGVYFATEILKKHNAKLRVESRLGRGTTITLIFPAHPNA